MWLERSVASELRAKRAGAILEAAIAVSGCLLGAKRDNSSQRSITDIHTSSFLGSRLRLLDKGTTSSVSKQKPVLSFQANTRPISLQIFS